MREYRRRALNSVVERISDCASERADDLEKSEEFGRKEYERDD